MDVVGNLMNGFGGRSSMIMYWIIDGFFQVGEYQMVVRSIVFVVGMCFYGFVEKVEFKGIVLFLKQVYQCGSVEC